MRALRLSVLLSAIAALALVGGPLPTSGSLADAQEAEPEMPTERIGHTPCVQGQAGPFRCHQVDLLTFLPPDEFGGGPSSQFGGPGNDVWGWTDPETKAEWVLMGRANGTSFIDISDPKDPVLVADLPSLETGLWSDVKVFENHAFIVKDGADNGIQVFDLTRLRDIDADDAPVTVDADALYDGISNAHNIAINEDTGFAYAVGATGGSLGQSPFFVTIDAPSPAAGTYDATGANFGPEPDETGVSGDVVLADDGVGTTTDACEPLVGFPAGAIALVDRGACNFTVKVANAQAAGATATIVANNVDGAPFTMGGSDPSIVIPSVMISLDDGNTIKAGLPASGTVSSNPEAVGCNGGGLHMVDVNDPQNPTFAGCFDEDGSTHDVQCVIYHGPDVRFQDREICFASNNSGAFGGPRLTTVDVTDKSNPEILSRTSQGAPLAFSHQSWTTDDHRYVLHNDESDEIQFGGRTRTRVFDISDLENVSVQAVYHGETRTSDHNLYVRGRYAYEANYTDGLRIIDITKIDHPGEEFAPETPSAPDHQGLREVACFDTDPTRNDIPGFGGSWSNYPFFKSGVVAVSGFDGLFLVKPRLGENAAFPPGSTTNPPSGDPGGNSGGGTAGCL